jgi:cell wall-associated NlpC family hydrolase
MSSLAPSQRQQARYVIRRYLERAEANQPRIHYSQFRPLTSLGDPPNSEFTTDCSGLVISAFRWADIWSAGFKVKDPGGYAYSGWGFTGSILSTNRRRRVPLDHKFFIGDMALFGPSLSHTTHVTICRRGGSTMSSIWTSHGSERGPYATRLMYRRDLLLVVRAESLA